MTVSQSQEYFPYDAAHAGALVWDVIVMVDVASKIINGAGSGGGGGGDGDHRVAKMLVAFGSSVTVLGLILINICPIEEIRQALVNIFMLDLHPSRFIVHFV